eukprot:1069113-Heterocapsa_arctica.AAC.1
MLASRSMGLGSSGPYRLEMAMSQPRATGTVVLWGSPPSSQAILEASAAAVAAEMSAVPLAAPKSCPSESATQ